MDNFFELFGKIVAAVGGAGVIILGFSSWFAKIWANKIYENDRLKHEKELKKIQNELDAKMAELNAQLEKGKAQFEILNRERIDVIKELYKKLTDVEDYIGMYYRSLTPDNAKEKIKSSEYFNLENCISDYMDYSNHNRIFFSKSACHDLSEIDSILTIIQNLNYKISISDGDENVEFAKQAIEISNKIIKNEIPKFKESLEKEFRNLLGVIE